MKDNYQCCKKEGKADLPHGRKPKRKFGLKRSRKTSTKYDILFKRDFPLIPTTPTVKVGNLETACQD